ncbi:MAG: dihydrolipoyl dehydrogenase [Leptospiraceae bacterium]|nr:dihydrolipoyl dehydrogenase [Leptospiraceae bacterium]
MSESIQVVVIGGGPGGYAAAFLAADLGLSVALIDKRDNPGGVCLYEGCIPSKALLHVAEVIHSAQHASQFGVAFKKPEIDLNKVRAFKSDVVRKLTGGLGQLAKRRAVKFIKGTAEFLNARQLSVKGADGEQTIDFEHAIIATGSLPTRIPVFPESERIMDSTGALELKEAPDRLLVVGGGYIGLEMSTVYAALGSRVTVVEMADQLLPGTDRDLVKPLADRLGAAVESIRLNTKVAAIREDGKVLKVKLESTAAESDESNQSEDPRNSKSDEQNSELVFDRVLVAAGRRPVTKGIGLENTGVRVRDDGFIQVDAQMRTTEKSIFAIGDVAGQPMLAHKASHEGRVAAEVIAGHKAEFDARAIPAVVFTDPEIAYCGLTETEARKQGRTVKVARFPWAASGRALSLGRNDGFTKLIIDPETERVLGMAIVGPGAGELIAEGVLAIEMGAVARDLALTIHPHPTLSETVMESAEVFFGQSTHIYKPT